MCVIVPFFSELPGAVNLHGSTGRHHPHIMLLLCLLLLLPYQQEQTEEKVSRFCHAKPIGSHYLLYCLLALQIAGRHRALVCLYWCLKMLLFSLNFLVGGKNLWFFIFNGGIICKYTFKSKKRNIGKRFMSCQWFEFYIAINFWKDVWCNPIIYIFVGD